MYGSTDEAIQGWVSSNTQYIAVKIKFMGQDKLPMSQYKSQEKSGYGLLTIARAPWRWVVDAAGIVDIVC